jgi:hypothetical protein
MKLLVVYFFPFSEVPYEPPVKVSRPGTEPWTDTSIPVGFSYFPLCDEDCRRTSLYSLIHKLAKLLRAVSGCRTLCSLLQQEAAPNRGTSGRSGERTVRYITCAAAKGLVYVLRKTDRRSLRTGMRRISGPKRNNWSRAITQAVRC